MKKFLSNASWIISEKFLNIIVSTIVSIFVTRYLGPTNYGMIAYSSAFVVVAINISSLGLENVVVREIVLCPEKKQEIMGTALLLRFVCGVLLMLVVVTIFAFNNQQDSPLFAITALQSFSILFKSFNIIAAYFDSKLQSKKNSIMQTIVLILISVIKIGLLFAKASVFAFALCVALESFFSATVLFALYKKDNKKNFNNIKLKFDFYTAKKLLKSGYHLVFAALMVSVYMQMDKIMIGAMLGKTQVGVYGVAVALASMWYFIPDAIIRSASGVIFFAKKNNDKNEYERRFRALCALIIIISVLAAIFFSFFGEKIILTVFGQAYAQAVGALKINIWAGVFAFLGSARNVWVVCENKIKYTSILTGVGAVINLVANYLLIPKMGINGAAIGTIVAQGAVALVAPMFFKALKPMTKIIWTCFDVKLLIKPKKV